MTRLLLMGLMMLALAQWGCRREEPAPAPPVTPPTPQVGAAEDADAVADKPELRSEYAQSLEQKLTQIEQGIDKLAAGAKTAATAGTESLDTALIEMQELAAKTKAKTEELKTATGEKWDQAKAETDRLMEKLTSAYNEAKEKVVGPSTPETPEAPQPPATP